MEPESPEEQISKQSNVYAQEYSEPQRSQNIIQKTLSIFGLGKERDHSTQTNSLTPAEGSATDSFIQPPNKEAIHLEDAARLEETRKKLQQETKTPTWVKRKDEGLLQGKITSKPLS